MHSQHHSPSNETKTFEGELDVAPHNSLVGVPKGIKLHFALQHIHVGELLVNLIFYKWVVCYDLWGGDNYTQDFPQEEWISSRYKLYLQKVHLC